jgi:hypothetical protein
MPGITKEQMIEDLKRYVKETGHAPNILDCKYCDYLCGYSTYIHKFGTMSQALRLAGYEPTEVFKKPVYKERIRPMKIKIYKSYGLSKIITDVELAEEMGDKNIFIRKLRNLKLYTETESYQREKAKDREKAEFILNKYSKILLYIKF